MSKPCNLQGYIFNNLERNVQLRNSSTAELTAFENNHSIMSREMLNEADNDVCCLGDQFDSIDLSEISHKDSLRINRFQVSQGPCVDTEGLPVQCRGNCIDVKQVYTQDKDGDTLLHIAIIILEPDLVHFFINMSPHFTWLNVRNKLSQTPLHLAVLIKDVALVRRLVVAGADIESRDKDGNMAIHLACRDNQLNILRALLEPVGYEEQKRNNYDIPVQKVPQNLEIKNYDGFTCLHIAAILGYSDVLKVLVDNGADVNTRAEKTGRTILHEAAWIGNVDLVKFIISLGNRCNINSRTYDGYTAFDLARSRGHWSIVLELATAGAKYEDDEIV